MPITVCVMSPIYPFSIHLLTSVLSICHLSDFDSTHMILFEAGYSGDLWSTHGSYDDGLVYLSRMSIPSGGDEVGSAVYEAIKPIISEASHNNTQVRICRVLLM
jgi:hypothetical protein